VPASSISPGEGAGRGGRPIGPADRTEPVLLNPAGLEPHIISPRGADLRVAHWRPRITWYTQCAVFSPTEHPARRAPVFCMALLMAFGSVAASHEVSTLTAAVHDLLATAGLAGSDQSTDALCRAVIAAPTPQQGANPPVMSGKTVAQAEHGHPSSADARWTDHVATVLHASESSTDHGEALRALEAHTHPMQTIPPLVDDDNCRVKGAAPSQAPGSATRGRLGSSPEARAGAGAGTKVGASKVLQKERQLRRRAEAARDAAEARERDLTRELKRERARRRRAEAA
jgi:hypothetical protein